MGFSFDGYVLRPPLVSSMNATETAEPETGVIRQICSLPSAYSLGAPAFVDVRADQYRTAILEAPGTSPTEYLVWAANTGSLALVDDPSWWVETGEGFIPQGEDTVDIFRDPSAYPPSQFGSFVYDGTEKVIIKDNGGRTLGTILAIVVARGDVTDYDDEGWVDENDPTQGRIGAKPYPFIIPVAGDQNPVSGVVTLTDSNVFAMNLNPPPTLLSGLTLLGGGLSQERGDWVVSVRYTVAPGRFWWTRNDRYETRFGWNGATQKWEPYKGSAPINLGILQAAVTYQMKPQVKNLPVNAFLPGNSATPDEYSMIRLGTNPSLSIPVGGIRVRPNAEVEQEYDFTLDPSINGVVGQSNGILQFNPVFVELNSGKTIWYTYKGFSSTADGVLGKLQDALTQPLFLAPIPGPTDACLLRIGNRHYLKVLLMPNDFLLSLFFPDEGEAVVSLSTGQVRLSLADVQKADPDSASFDKNYLGEDVVYDGVALNQVPQSTTKPVQLVDSTGTPALVGSGTLYIPGYQVLPTDFTDASDNYRGLGVSGILDISDATGAFPKYPAQAASVRPGGDSLASDNTGRVRQLDDGVSDIVLFGQPKSLVTVNVVDRDTDLPTSLKVRKGEAWVSRQPSALGAGGWGSQVVLGRKDLVTFDGLPLYFMQPAVTPATYTEEARIYSRSRDIFRFSANQVLYFAIDGIAHTWTAPIVQTFYTADEVAADIMANAVPAIALGRVYAQNGRVVLEADVPVTGTVEIGWGGATKDLSGAEVLGFLPGWRVQGGVPNWLPDSGVTLGMFRSPVNLDRSDSIPDSRAECIIEDSLLVESVQANPFVFMTYPPLQDVAGYDEGVFFNLRTLLVEGETVQIIDKPLVHYKDIIHRFGQKRFDWVKDDSISQTVDTAVSVLALGQPSVVPESLLGAVGIGGGFYVSEDGGPSVAQIADQDYILPQNGASGLALLVSRYGGRHSYGAQGQVVAGGTQFTDPNADFTTVQPGYRLKLLAEEPLGGSYLVQSVTNSQTVEVLPAFSVTPASPVTWEMFQGYTDSVYDPSLVADQVYGEFNHLTDEPFKVRLLGYLGLTPASVSDQLASRLKANMEAALASNRPISLRYGLVEGISTNTVTLTALAQTNLGVIANGSLIIPDVTSTRFTSQAFSVRVGTQLFAHDGTSLRPVTSFTPTFTDGIEYLTVASGTDPVGRLKFGTNVLSSYSSASVYYVEEFLSAAALAQLTAEYDPNTGYLNLSAADITTQVGQKVYFVEQMITEQQQDVTLQPLAGTFAFNQPIPVGSAVEASYYRADLEGRKIGNLITEFLPTFVRSEVATRIQENVYTFGIATVDQDIDPVVYIGPIQQNFGKTDYLVDYPASLNGQGRITFISHTVPDYIPVMVSYAIYEAQGGERTYDASQRLIYRPPFFIKAEQSKFGIWGNRMSEFQVGQLLRIGADCFYVKGTRYYPTEDITAIYIFPSTVNEVGTRAPGHDVVSVITAGPITTVVDPDGDTPIPTTAPAGFMSVIDTNTFPFEPVSRGSKDITFTGNLMQFAIPGHIFEIGGYPYTISEVTLNDDGTRTKISVTSGFQVGFNVISNPTVKLSYRPIYPPNVTEFLGLGPLVTEEGSEVIRFDGVNPGQTLRPLVDYTLDSNSGAIRLIETSQEPLQAGEKLFLSHTRLRTLQPFMKDGVATTPRYSASYLHGVIPDAENGYLGAQVVAAYTFRNPDSFYFRAVRLPAFLTEATQEAVQEITGKQPASGVQVSVGGDDNWEKGRLGLKGERRHLEDKDRAARTFLDFYNQTIETFEQVTETISGSIIGDRDGKFRFFVGHGKDWSTPGYEDAITGTLQPRNVWSEVFNEANPALDMNFLETDWVVDPRYAGMTNGELTGWLPGSNSLDFLLTRQEALIYNDVDDLVMTRTGRKRLEYVFPTFRSRAKGIFAPMYQQHRFSRLFPTITKAFTYTAPGAGGDPNAGDFGIYTWGRVIDGEFQRTRKTTIGQLQNPVLGEISNVSTATLSRRYSRGRVWAYLPDGIPVNAFTNGTLPAVAIQRPVIIALPVLMRDIPINPDTGFPDDLQMLSQGGSVPDALAGDPDLAVPGFMPGDQVKWGKSDGTVYNLYTPNEIDVIGQFAYTGVFVEDVLFGCVLTLKDASDNPITDPANVLIGTSPNTGVPLEALPVDQGDTVFACSPSGTQGLALSDNPSFQTYVDLSSGSEDYRTGTDIAVKSDGRLIDITLPSFYDYIAWGLKEMTGQNPPAPMTPIEGEVEFYYADQNPFEFPALNGLWQDDSGDYQIPYMKTANTELDCFEDLGDTLPDLVLAMSAAPDSRPVYPDEALGNDGAIVGAIGTGFLESEPATLLSSQADVLKWTHTGELGTGDVQPFDLVFVETGTPVSTEGITGIQTVGATSHIVGGGSLIELPRFPTPTADLNAVTKVTSSPMRYVFENYAVYVDPASPVYVPDPQAGTPPPGIEIIEDTATNEVILEFNSMGAYPIFNDGLTADVGGLNEIKLANVNNVIRIDIYSRPDPNVTLPIPPPPLPSTGAGNFIMSIYLQTFWAWTEDYTGALTGGPAFAVTDYGHGAGFSQIRIQAANSIMPWNVCPAGSENQWVIPHSLIAGIRKSLYGLEFKISVNTFSTVGLPTPPGDGESHTAWVAPDRLTFNEVIDMQYMKPRGYVHPVSGVNMESSLMIHDSTFLDGAGNPFWCDILNYANGGVPFTFLERSSGLGTWVSATATPTVERGSCKVMSCEGDGNTPITGTDLTFSVASSNYRDEVGFICLGTGYTESQYNSNVAPALGWEAYENRITDITALGSIGSVVPGDIAIIKGYPNTSCLGSMKTGTYLIRHGVDPTVGKPYRETLPDTEVGAFDGWCPVEFPVVDTFDPMGVLTVKFVTGFDPADTFPVAGRVYIIRDERRLTSADADTFKVSVISAQYAGVPVSSDPYAVFLVSNYRDALGNALTAADFEALLDDAYPVSGMSLLKMQVGGEQGLPANNCVGYHDDTTPLSIHGVALSTFSTQNIFGAGTTTDLLFDASLGAIAGGISNASGVGWIGVADAPAAAVEIYQPDVYTPVYRHVPQSMDIGQLTTTQWKTLNIPPASAGGASLPGNLYVRCILPGTRVALGDLAGPTSGFYAQGGIFLEPSFPRSALNLVAAYPRVVDEAHSGTMPDPTVGNDEDKELGMRDASHYGSTAVVPDQVLFEVRRIRRFHGESTEDAFQSLRYAYEMRRGVITNSTTNNRQRTVIEAAAGTNLGLFNNPDVNINPGDSFRLLDSDGTLLESVEIASIVDGTHLKLVPPGLITTGVVGKQFEIWLRQAPVPHEQSNEQLLDIITTKEVTETTADWIAGTGGFCTTINQLQDSQKNIPNLGVQKGDIVIIDPMGSIPREGGLPVVQESGVRPIGDTGVAGRTGFTAGVPSELDDNRGYYHVSKVVGGATPYLELNPVSTFAGGPSSGEWVIFGPPGFEYAVYPTISASSLPAGVEEGQMDLRETHDRDPVTKSFQHTPYSIQPFSYRVIRPSALFSQEAIDLVLLMRERMLSWMEILNWGKAGPYTYHAFQQYNQVSDIGNYFDPVDGLGVVSNAYIQSLLGELGEVPYTNNRSCLSLLDRRFWVLDTRLDALTTLNDFQMRKAMPGDTPYTAYNDPLPGGGGEVRPVLPDHIDLILNQTDRFRPIRYVWLAYRTHKLLGTLSALERYDVELPDRLLEQKRLILLQEAVEKIE